MPWIGVIQNPDLFVGLLALRRIWGDLRLGDIIPESRVMEQVFVQSGRCRRSNWPGGG